MNIHTKQNFEEKIRLILIELVSSLENNFKLMLRKHAADGMIRSGQTIKATMNMIADLTEKLYTDIMSYVDILNLKYFPTIEADISALALNAQQKLKIETIEKLQKSTEMAGSPNLFERMLPDVEADMANKLATFQNNLNAKVIELKQNTEKSPFEKSLWVIEFIVLAISIFVSGMWFNDPQGNYEPLLVGFALIMPLIYLIIRCVAKQ